MKKHFKVAFLSSFTALTLGLSGSVKAADQPQKSIVLDPATVRTQLLNANLTLEQEQKTVDDAKTSVALARAGLFPSINVSALFNGNFVLSGVDFLVPFLIPSNWAELDKDKHLFEAEKLAYKALALNTYSSALSLYFNIRSDNEITQLYLQEAKDLRDIASYIQKAAHYGFASDEDVQNALGNAEAAEGQASKMQVAMIKELAALRQALGLPLDIQIQFSTSPAAATIPASDAEAFTSPADIAKEVDKSLSVAPESAQINELINAATAEKWSKLFGWINSASVTTIPSQSGSSASFSKLEAKGTISLGLQIFPMVELSNRNIEEIKLRLTELKQENTQILEGSILATHAAQDEHNHFAQAEEDLSSVYNATLKQYQLGIASLYDVLQAHKQLSLASVNRAQAELDLTLLRVTLHRTLLTDEFAKIPNCAAQAPAQSSKRDGLAGWWDGLFGSDDDGSNDVSLLELCKAK